MSKVVHGLKNFRSAGMAIEGMEEVASTLTDLMPREVRNLSRAAVHGVAIEIRKGMRARAPEDTGTLRKAIQTKKNRMYGNHVSSDVLITKGAGQKHDAWYFHMVEWGTQKGQPAQPFIVPTIEEMRPQIPDIFREQVGKKLEQLMARKAKKK